MPSGLGFLLVLSSLKTPNGSVQRPHMSYPHIHDVGWEGTSTSLSRKGVCNQTMLHRVARFGGFGDPHCKVPTEPHDGRGGDINCCIKSPTLSLNPPSSLSWAMAMPLSLSTLTRARVSYPIYRLSVSQQQTQTLDQLDLTLTVLKETLHY